MTSTTIDPATIRVPHAHPYVAGRHVEGSGGDYDIVSPSTGSTVATISLPSRADLDVAVEKARIAQEQWRRTGVWQRIEILHRVGDLITAHRDEIAQLQSLEQGKPLAESYADIDETATLFHLHSEDALRLYGETLPSKDQNKRIFTFHQAVGVWGVVLPWNYPVLMWAEFSAPGLATGNAIITKPATNAPLSLLATVGVLEEAGLPEGLISILPGEGTFGADLVSHPGVDAIGFIGSSTTAERVLQTAGLKRSIVEASGNGPVVVLDDANLQAAADAAVVGAYYNAGQVCVATGRVLVHRDIRAEFVQTVREAAKQAVVGDPFDPATTLGPMNNRDVADKVDRHLADARDRGFDFVTDGGQQSGFATDLFYGLAVVDGVTEDALLHTEETFGPVLPIVEGADDEDLIRIANSDPLGLQGAVFTSSLKRSYNFIENLRVGQVVVNDMNGYWDINMPFGGVGGKRTGWGRIGGKYTLMDMTDLRTAVVDMG
jgi:acyl-CoA reductase-like NAD-dependent aldehyde dehydrogenase